MRLSARGLGSIFGRLLIGTAETIPASELVDTTGCGDAFIGAVLHGEDCTLLPKCHFQAFWNMFFFIGTDRNYPYYVSYTVVDIQPFFHHS